MGLRLCDSCERHVRDRETRCPFCDAALVPMVVALPVAVRTSRALQAVVIAASLAGCREEPKATPEAAPAPSPSPVLADTKPASIEPKTEEPDTAPPAPSPSPTPTHKPPPAPTPTPHSNPNLKKPYGAPPAEGLLV